MEHTKRNIDLFVFYTKTQDTKKILNNGADGVIIDWEMKNKSLRQALFDTQINMHSINDLKDMRAETNSKIICRINRFSEIDDQEIEESINKGTDELLLPMVQTAREVEIILKKINGRCPLGILLETDESIKRAKDLSTLPLSRVYIGLNDLAIDRRYGSIFEPVFNGVIQEIRPLFKTDFGFGGLTMPSLGSPVPCRILLNEIKKHNCTFAFLRRSFFRDSQIVDSSIIISEIRKEFAKPAFNYKPGFDYKKFL